RLGACERGLGSERVGAEEGAGAGHEDVEGAGDADSEALQAAGERACIFRLDEQVDVIAHHGVVDEAEAELVAAAPERALDDLEAATGAQIPDVLVHAQRDVHGEAPGQDRTRAMGHAGLGALGLAAGARALAAPGAQDERLLPTRTALAACDPESWALR